MTEPLFNEDTPKLEENEDKSFLETLVGEGKRYSDQEALAKAAMDKDAHILRVEQENKELRESVSKNKTVEELLREQEDMFKAKQLELTPDSTPKNPLEETQNVNPVEQAPDIEELLEKKLQERENTAKSEQNLLDVREQLQQAYGPEVGMVWNKVKDSLGLGEDEMRAMAKSKPKVLVQLVNSINPVSPTKEAPNLFGAVIDSSKSMPTDSGGKKNYNYYKDLKSKQNGMLTGPQNAERLLQAQKLGDAFFN